MLAVLVVLVVRGEVRERLALVVLARLAEALVGALERLELAAPAQLAEALVGALERLERLEPAALLARRAPAGPSLTGSTWKAAG